MGEFQPMKEDFGSVRVCLGVVGVGVKILVTTVGGVMGGGGVNRKDPKNSHTF